MQKTILSQVVSRVRVRRQLAQEVSDLRLVPANELTERGCILCGYDACNELVILGVNLMRRRVDQSRPAYRHMSK